MDSSDRNASYSFLSSINYLPSTIPNTISIYQHIFSQSMYRAYIYFPFVYAFRHLSTHPSIHTTSTYPSIHPLAHPSIQPIHTFIYPYMQSSIHIITHISMHSLTHLSILSPTQHIHQFMHSFHTAIIHIFIY